MKMIKIVMLGILMAGLPACSAVRYDYRGESDGVITLKSRTAKVCITGANANSERIKNATSEALLKKGIQASFVEDQSEADLKIEIIKDRFYTLPQEYQSGFSFGIIPSWGTREDKYIYNFLTPSAHFSIHVDETTYNHALLMPVCLLELPFMGEPGILKKAMSRMHFKIEESERQ